MLETLLGTYFATISGVAALNVAITEFLNSTFNIQTGWVKQVISWICPVLLSVLGLVFGWGLFASYGTISSVLAWVYTVLTGLGVGLVSNGIYDIQWVQNVITFVKDLFTKTKINDGSSVATA